MTGEHFDDEDDEPIDPEDWDDFVASRVKAGPCYLRKKNVRHFVTRRQKRKVGVRQAVSTDAETVARVRARLGREFYEQLGWCVLGWKPEERYIADGIAFSNLRVRDEYIRLLVPSYDRDPVELWWNAGLNR